MPTAQVDSYGVGFQMNWVKRIHLWTRWGDEGSRSGPGIMIFFTDIFPPRLHIESESSMWVFMPESHFRDMYHVLQTEKPVFVKWSTTVDTKFDVYTGKEDLAEGFSEVPITVELTS